MDSAPRMWPDETVVILGCGPSLTREDVDYVRGKARVIAINTAWTLAPWADVLYSADRRWWAHYRGAMGFPGLKYSIGSGRGKHDSVPKHPEVVVLKHMGDEGICVDPTGLKTGRNSGASAINLAVHFGASRILLLGYNMGRGKGKSHFFGDHPPGLQNHSPYVLFLQMFKTQVAPLAEAGIEVINCTRKSALECFPKRDLRTVLLDPTATTAPALEAVC